MPSLAKVKLFVARNELLFWIRNPQESEEMGEEKAREKKLFRKLLNSTAQGIFVITHDGANWNECVRKNVISFSHLPK